MYGSSIRDKFFNGGKLGVEPPVIIYGTVLL
jgi:hypothetical protein